VPVSTLRGQLRHLAGQPEELLPKNSQIISGIRDTSVERPLTLYRPPDTASNRYAAPSEDLATGPDILLYLTLLGRLINKYPQNVTMVSGQINPD
jgi:hypothetical protein